MRFTLAILLVLVYFGNGLGFIPHPKSPRDILYVCCIQNEWQAQLFLDSGIVWIDSNTDISYRNGTVHVAYSYNRQKLYYDATVTERSSRTPHRVTQNITILMDYSLNVLYYAADGQCWKNTIGVKMQKLCIPRNATLQSTEVFGDEMRLLDTYKFMHTFNEQWQVSVTVFRNRLTPIEPKMCVPFRASFYKPAINPKSGTLYTVDVMDYGPIKSEDIFDIPRPCRSYD